MKLKVDNIDDLKKWGVYKITNTENDKVYVGSTKSFRKRFSQHKDELKRKKHGNPKLQHAWDFYGEDCFEFSILEVCLENRVEREKYYIAILQAANRENGYNINANPDKPCSFNVEIRNKISQTLKEKYKKGILKPTSTCFKKGRVSPMKGKKFEDTSNFHTPKTITEALKTAWEKSKITSQKKARAVEVFNKNYELLHKADSILTLHNWSLTEDNNLPIVCDLRVKTKRLDISKVCNACKSGKTYKGLYFKAVKVSPH